MKTQGVRLRQKKKALKPEWVWLCLSDGKEVTSVNVGYSYLGVNVPQGKSSMSSQTFVLSVRNFSLFPSPAFKQSLFKIRPGGLLDSLLPVLFLRQPE